MSRSARRQPEAAAVQPIARRHKAIGARGAGPAFEFPAAAAAVARFSGCLGFRKHENVAQIQIAVHVALQPAMEARVINWLRVAPIPFMIMLFEVT